jgi:hypothetical protein
MGLYHGSMGYTISGRKKKSMRRKAVSRTVGHASNIARVTYRRITPDFPSATETAGVAARVEPPRYTGTLVKGIGTMHKSNAVPIIDEEQMKDIARMRR